MGYIVEMEDEIEQNGYRFCDFRIMAKRNVRERVERNRVNWNIGKRAEYSGKNERR